MITQTMPAIGLPCIPENMLQSAVNDTNLTSWNINGNGPLTYINLKFNMDSIRDKTGKIQTWQSKSDEKKPNQG